MLDAKRLENRKIKAQQMEKLATIYENSLEPRVVLLYRELEKIVATAEVPLLHINLVLDMLKRSCVEQAYDKYVTTGHEKLKGLIEKK